MALATDLTYAQIRARIASELNRDDLDTVPLTDSSEIHKFFKERVLHYSNEFFYNAQFIDTTKSTAASSSWVDLADGWQQVTTVKLLHGTSWLTLTQVDHATIVQLESVSPPVEALPTMFAVFLNPSTGKMALRLWSTPDAAYDLEIIMDKPPDAPTADTDTNFWTNDAQALMIAATAEQICKRYINRPLKAQAFEETRVTEENSLDSKTIRIGGGVRVKPFYL